jgi:hypothetical protein
MGDRTSVTLTIPTVYKEAALAIFGNDGPQDEFESTQATSELTYCRWYEVNYGTLPHLDDLMKAGIPFDSEWDSGSEYGPGTESCRFTPDGDAQRKEVADDSLNPSMSRCLALIDNLEALRQYILTHKESVTSLPWENQVEYSKRYRLKQLIAHTEE